MDAETLKKKLQKQNPLMMSPMAFGLAACGGGSLYDDFTLSRAIEPTDTPFVGQIPRPTAPCHTGDWLVYRPLDNDEPTFTHACHCKLCERYTAPAFVVHSLIEASYISVLRKYFCISNNDSVNFIT
mgnify:CR=1 FL=1